LLEKRVAASGLIILITSEYREPIHASPHRLYY
jgi:hypothetical protein